jgi:hypothetical protein
MSDDFVGLGYKLGDTSLNTVCLVELVRNEMRRNLPTLFDPRGTITFSRRIQLLGSVHDFWESHSTGGARDASTE